jgi:hypothetical protein
MKIGVLGTAWHVTKAPFDDPSWELWAANVGQVPRWDRWFDLHDDASIDTYPGHREFLSSQTKPVYLRTKSIVSGQPYPLEVMTAKYGTWFFTSTIAYMLAMAIEEGPEEIGLWGVDLAHDTEYRHQKPGCRFFLQTALLKGIKVVMPPEAEVATPGKLYAYAEPTWLEMKARTRVAELRARVDQLQQQRNNLVLEKTALAAIKGSWSIPVPPEEVEKRLAEMPARERALENEALVLDGGLQNAVHVLQNWAGVES